MREKFVQLTDKLYCILHANQSTTYMCFAQDDCHAANITTPQIHLGYSVRALLAQPLQLECFVSLYTVYPGIAILPQQS